MTDFLNDQITCAIAIVSPEEGVRKGYCAPYFSHEGALAEMSQPQHAPVQATAKISSHVREMLGQGSRAFFQAMLRPTIKHQ